MSEHTQTPDGESTENWAIRRQPGFLGSIRQLLDCARCGERLIKRHDEPVPYRDVFKPTIHVICDECNEELPS